MNRIHARGLLILILFAGFGAPSSRADNDVVISEDGFVGIHTDSPNAPLHVNGKVAINADSSQRVKLGYSSTGSGVLSLYKGSVKNVFIGAWTSEPALGALHVAGSKGDHAVVMEVVSNGEIGAAYTYGPNREKNVDLGDSLDNARRGRISVRDKKGIIQAEFTYKHDGTGIVKAEGFTSLTDHPTRSRMVINYPVLHGPRPDVFVRGTARLQAGRATVSLPEHFRHLAAREGITVRVTPLAAESKGLAVTAKSNTRIEVRELLKGTGEYDFDWEVKAPRQNAGDHKTVRAPDPTKASAGPREDES